MRQLDYRLLGPLEVVVGGEPLSLGRRQQRAVLAILLLNLNEVVSTDRLVELLWPARRPGRPLTAVQGYVSALRKLLGREAIETSGGGYVLRAAAEQLDSGRFERLRREGVEALAGGRAPRAASLLEEALSLFRGPPLADFTYEPWAQNEAGRLEELRLTALEDRVDAELALGRHGELAAELESLVAEQPLRERRRAQLMLALYRCGRQAEALEAYRSFRHLLAAELGIDPSPELKELERRILQHDVELAAAAPARLVGGTVTLLATDIEGSTRLLQRLGDAYRGVLAEQRRILLAAVGAHGGIEVDSQGDSALVAFVRANDAVRAAGDLQRRLADAEWPNGERLRVRVGIHTGEPSLSDGRYVGLDVHRVARICAAAHGGQIVLSRETRELVDAHANELQLIDLGEHRLKDLNEPERLYQIGDDHFPPLKSLHQTNLPTPPNRLIGRQRELAEIETLLRNPEIRLLTLTGAGGTGKTRLAVAAAREIVSSFADGAVFVDLAPLQDPELLLPTIARSVQVPEQAEEHLAVTLRRHLDRRQVLLLLDNLEHLVAVAPTIAELLGSCVELKVLATSRVPLRVTGEHAYELQPLEEEDAAALLAERVRSVHPVYDVDSQNAAVLRAICRRLDGLPLALELAAPRFKILTPETLLARLERSLDVLTGGFRDLPKRQQTLRATIEWSFQMLLPEEQRLLARMSVFAGGCTLAAAEVVCAEAGSSILDTLGSLVDHSLVRVIEADGGERFRLLETIREFASGELRRAGETDELVERHRAWIADVMEDVWSRWLVGDRLWRPRAEAELDNARVALRKALDDGRGDIGAKIAAALYPFWSAQAPSEGREWLESALETLGRQPAPPRSLFALAGLLWPIGAYDRADYLLERAADEARAEGDGALVRRALAARGGVKMSRGEPGAAVRLIEEALTLARADGDILVLRRALNILAGIRFEQRDLARAKSLLLEALELAHESDDETGEALVNSNLGRVALVKGAFEESASYAERAVAASARTGDAYQAGQAALGLALAFLLGGKPDDACTWFLKALDVGERPPDYAPSCLWGLAAADAAAGELTRAARLLGAANAAFESLGTAPDAIERQIDEAILNDARARLGDRWAEEETAGRRMSIDNAIALWRSGFAAVGHV